MRTIVINDGDTLQVDLVPENEREEAILNMFEDGATLKVGKASGYARCRGGYLRPYADDSARSFVYLMTLQKKPVDA